MKATVWVLVLASVLVMAGQTRADELHLMRLIDGSRTTSFIDSRLKSLVQDEQVSFGGWGGFTYSLFFPDLHDFRAITKDRGLPGFSSSLGMWSGRGFVSINHLRIGGFFSGGVFVQDEYVHHDHRQANLDIFYGGFSLDYLFPLSDRIGIFAGGIAGGGGVWMSAHGHDLLHSFSQGQTFGFVAPEAGLSFKVAPFMRIEATAQYNFFNLDTHGSYILATTGERYAVDITDLSGPQLSLWLLWGYGD
jgi:hypothetical protein